MGNTSLLILLIIISQIQFQDIFKDNYCLPKNCLEDAIAEPLGNNWFKISLINLIPHFLNESHLNNSAIKIKWYKTILKITPKSVVLF